jgi:hypothetical protein
LRGSLVCTSLPDRLFVDSSLNWRDLDRRITFAMEAQTTALSDNDQARDRRKRQARVQDPKGDEVHEPNGLESNRKEREKADESSKKTVGRTPDGTGMLLLIVNEADHQSLPFRRPMTWCPNSFRRPNPRMRPIFSLS